MAFNGSGTFTRIYNWVVDKANGINITASRMDTEFDGIATGLSTCITKDGQTTLTANIPFANYKITGLGNGTARSDAINVGQVQDNQFLYLGTTTGSADAYTLSPAPTITAYATTQQFVAKIHATNATTTPYLQISGIANPASTAVIKKLNASRAEVAVEASDLLANGIYKFQRNSANDAWIILNPEKPFINLLNGTKATTTTQGISFLNNPITIANNATDANNDIDFSAGNFQFSDGSGQAVATAMTKRLDATWSAGTNQGGLLNGTAVPKAIDSTYHCYAIYNPTSGVSDFAFLLGVAGTAPDPTSVLPSGYTKYDFRGSILTDGSGNIRAFKQNLRNFIYGTNITAFSGASPALNTDLTLTIPVGVQVGAILSGTIGHSGAGYLIYYLKSKIQGDNIVAGTIGDVAATRGSITPPNPIFSNTSAQIQHGRDASGGSATVVLLLHGWIDNNIKL